MIKLTIEPRGGEKGELDAARLNGIPRIVSAELMIDVSQVLARHYNGTVRCYDEADICVVTATANGWTPGYREEGYIPFPGN